MVFIAVGFNPIILIIWVAHFGWYHILHNRSNIGITRNRWTKLKINILIRQSMRGFDLQKVTPCYEKILLPMDFERLPLQSYCDDPYSLILMIHGAYERRGMELITGGRTNFLIIAYAWKRLRKDRGHSKNALKHHFENPF